MNTRSISGRNTKHPNNAIYQLTKLPAASVIPCIRVVSSATSGVICSSGCCRSGGRRRFVSARCVCRLHWCFYIFRATAGKYYQAGANETV